MVLRAQGQLYLYLIILACILILKTWRNGICETSAQEVMCMFSHVVFAPPTLPPDLAIWLAKKIKPVYSVMCLEFTTWHDPLRHHVAASFYTAGKAQPLQQRRDAVSRSVTQNETVSSGSSSGPRVATITVVVIIIIMIIIYWLLTVPSIMTQDFSLRTMRIHSLKFLWTEYWGSKFHR